MANQAKKQSDENGSAYLSNVLLGVEKQMQLSLELQSNSQTHDGTMGGNCEDLWRDLLRRYLPARYQIEEAFIIDSEGRTSDQIDVVIFDATYCAPLHGHDHKKYLPRESVYAVFEAKPTVTKEYLEYAGKKAASVIELTCTTAPIINAGKNFPARQIFKPITGLLASDASWSAGLYSSSFSSNLPTTESERLDFVLTAKSGFCDARNDPPESIVEGRGAMMAGVFRLLQALQELGTVPAIDWAIYERVLDEKLGLAREATL